MEPAESIPIAGYRSTRDWTFKSYPINELDFRFNTPIPSLNQGQGRVFKVRKCAQSVLRLEKPKYRRFSHKSPKMFDFRFNTPIRSLNRKRFHASRMRTIDSPHRITPFYVGEEIFYMLKFTYTLSIFCKEYTLFDKIKPATNHIAGCIGFNRIGILSIKENLAIITMITK
jgi:hypothetical protein